MTSKQTRRFTLFSSLHLYFWTISLENVLFSDLECSIFDVGSVEALIKIKNDAPENNVIFYKIVCLQMPGTSDQYFKRVWVTNLFWDMCLNWACSSVDSNPTS